VVNDTTSGRWSPHRLPRIRQQMMRLHRDAAADMPAIRDRARELGTEQPDVDSVAELTRTADALGAAELFWVTRDMTAVALDASATIPAWTPAAARPAPFGLLVWDGGLPELAWRGAPDMAWTVNALGLRVPPTVPVDGVLWGPGPRGIRFTLLTGTAALDQLGALVPRWAATELFAFGMIDLPLLEDVPTTSRDWSSGLIAALGATWLLMMQPTVAEPRPLVEPPEPDRPGTRRPRSDRAVTVIDLRRTHPARADRTDSGDGPSRVYTRRWLVRGHWRQQAVGPGRSQRRPTYVPPYVKGPDGAPMIETERVNVWRR
jgi:hypothetical protein